MQEWRPRDVRAGIRLRQSRAVWQDGYDWRSGADSASSATCSGPRAVREGFSAFGARRNADPDVGTAVGNALSVGGSSTFHQAKVERQSGQQQDSDSQTPSMAAGIGGVAGSTWVRPGWIVGREDWGGLPARLGGHRRCSTPWTSRLEG